MALPHLRWRLKAPSVPVRSEEHTSELQSPCNLVCRLLLEKKKYLTSYPLICSPEAPAQTPLRYGAAFILAASPGRCTSNGGAIFSISPTPATFPPRVVATP